METASVYKHRDYKEYLREQETSKTVGQRGYRSRLAKAMGCNTAFVSHVLNGAAHFSLEQACALNRLFDHSAEQGHFFLLLVQLCRAGTPDLRKYFENQVEVVLDGLRNIKSRLGVREKLSLEDRALYFSTWEYSAVHLLLNIPKFSTVSEIAARLKMAPERVTQILRKLIEMGLVVDTGSRLRSTETRMHLGQDSSLIARHHSNWRVRSLTALQELGSEDLHYSSVVTISEADARILRLRMVDFIANLMPAIDASKEEKILSFCLDFYHL